EGIGTLAEGAFAVELRAIRVGIAPVIEAPLWEEVLAQRIGCIRRIAVEVVAERLRRKIKIRIPYRAEWCRNGGGGYATDFLGSRVGRSNWGPVSTHGWRCDVAVVVEQCNVTTIRIKNVCSICRKIGRVVRNQIEGLAQCCDSLVGAFPGTRLGRER